VGFTKRMSKIKKGVKEMNAVDIERLEKIKQLEKQKYRELENSFRNLQVEKQQLEEDKKRLLKENLLFKAFFIKAGQLVEEYLK